MTIFALLGWMVLGMVLGAVFATVWKLRGLTLAWGVAAGGVGGVAGGLIGRTVLPAGAVFTGLSLAIAAFGAVLAMFIARASVRNEQSGTV